MIASDNGQQFLFPRLFKNIPEAYWNGNIHNHLSILGTHLGDVRITHGYSPAHNLDPDRAFRILKKEVETRPDAIREMFYLGREYFYRKDYENTVVLMGKYVQRSNHLAEKAEAFLIMSRSYWNMGMAEDARDAILQAIKINAHFKEALVFMAVLAGKGTGNDGTTATTIGTGGPAAGCLGARDHRREGRVARKLRLSSSMVSADGFPS